MELPTFLSSSDLGPRLIQPQINTLLHEYKEPAASILYEGSFARNSAEISRQRLLSTTLGMNLVLYGPLRRTLLPLPNIQWSLRPQIIRSKTRGYPAESPYIIPHPSTQPGHLIATIGTRDISGETHSKVADVSAIQVLYHGRRLEF